LSPNNAWYADGNGDGNLDNRGLPPAHANAVHIPSNRRYRREDFDTWIRHQKTLAAAAFRAKMGK
jgi:hypothetical protein